MLKRRVACPTAMTADFRPKLLSMSAKLDQLLTQADEILTEPIHADLYAMAEELRETVVDMLNPPSTTGFASLLVNPC